MASYDRIADFLATGCAVVPALSLCAGRPEFALFSHIALLFAGIVVIAACDGDAPFKRCDSCDDERR